jgi:hypothetical protein
MVCTEYLVPITSYSSTYLVASTLSDYAADFYIQLACTSAAGGKAPDP